MSQEIMINLPINYITLKKKLREGLTDSERTFLYPLLPSLPKNGSINELPDIHRIAENLMKMIEPSFSSFLSPESSSSLPSSASPSPIHSQSTSSSSISSPTYTSKKFSQLTELVKKNQRCEELILLYVLLKKLCLVIPRLDVCYLTVCDLLANQERYIIPTAIAHRTRLDVFRSLLRDYMPRTFAVLYTMGALEERYLNLMFVGFFERLLPAEQVMRILDAFMLEGYRVLYRYGLALLQFYKADVKANKYSTGEDFWREVENHAKEAEIVPTAGAAGAAAAAAATTAANDAVTPADADGIREKISVVSGKGRSPIDYTNALHDASFDSSRSVFAKALKPMGISHKSIKRLSAEAENSIRKEQGQQQQYEPLSYTFFQDVNAIDEDGERQIFLEYRSGSHSSGDGVSEKENRKVGKREGEGETNKNDKEIDVGMNVRFQSDITDTDRIVKKSTILNRDTTSQLMRYLPSIVKLDGLELAFSTSRDGFNLTSLYDKTQGLVSIVLVLRVKTKTSKAIVGAFLPRAISPPSRAIRGNGETFLFRLDGSDKDDMEKEKEKGEGEREGEGKAVKYGWIGPSAHASPTTTTDQFYYCCNEYISVGGSEAHSTSALCIDDDLCQAWSGSSDTFGNTTGLMSTDEYENGKSTFKIQELEVWCSRSSYEKALREDRFRKQPNILS